MRTIDDKYAYHDPQVYLGAKTIDPAVSNRIPRHRSQYQKDQNTNIKNRIDVEPETEVELDEG